MNGVRDKRWYGRQAKQQTSSDFLRTFCEMWRAGCVIDCSEVILRVAW